MKTMLKTIPKRMLALILVLVMIIGGCSSGTSNGENKKDKKVQKITYNTVNSESWDPLRDSTAASWTHNTLERLMSWEKNELVLGAAKSIDLSDDGLVYTIKIRDEAKWSDGKDLVAEDFRYGIVRILKPENACKYVKESYYIKNAMAYNKGEVSEEEVGVKVIDDKTLEITLEAPCAYFKELLTNKRYSPMRKDLIEDDPNWWQDPEKFIGNGPYIIEKMLPNEKVILKKNPNYYDAASVKLEELEIRFIEDQQVELMAFKNNEIQIGVIPAPEAIESLKQSGELIITPKLSIYYLVLNNQTAPVNDPKVRKALAMAIDRKQIVENITKGDEIPAYGLCPNTVMDYGVNKPFRDVYPEYFDENIEEAKKLLADAGYPEGKGFPEITYAISSGGDHAKIAQAIQSMWKTNLGIASKIESLETTVFIKERKAGTYPIARYMWSSSYADPIAWLSLYLSTDENNDSKYVKKEYDEIINKALTEVDVKKRFELLHDAEKMIIEDDMAVIPLFYLTNKFYIKKEVKDVGFTSEGALTFKYAYIE